MQTNRVAPFEHWWQGSTVYAPERSGNDPVLAWTIAIHTVPARTTLPHLNKIQHMGVAVVTLDPMPQAIQDDSLERQFYIPPKHSGCQGVRVTRVDTLRR